MTRDEIERIRDMAETRQWGTDGEAADAMLALLAEIERLRAWAGCTCVSGIQLRTPFLDRRNR